jgi:protein farnesyltransferase/geranylgeranyltransferase type-1 subunit alpha
MTHRQVVPAKEKYQVCSFLRFELTASLPLIQWCSTRCTCSVLYECLKLAPTTYIDTVVWILRGFRPRAYVILVYLVGCICQRFVPTMSEHAAPGDSAWFDEATWADVTPLPALDTDAPPLSAPITGDPVQIRAVASISYMPGYAKALSYFRAVLQNGEISERVYRLCAAIISYNAAHYTAWSLRRDCILKGVASNDTTGCAAKVDAHSLTDALQSECVWITRIATGGSKNYQLWYQRQWVWEQRIALLTAAFSPSPTDVSERLERAKQVTNEELRFTAQVIGEEGKHYHAWAHRQYVLHRRAHCSDWDAELSYADTIIGADVRNNSGWNHRWFSVTHKYAITEHTPEAGLPADVTTSTLLPIDIILAELSYAFECLRHAKKNESVWNYVRGLLKNASLQGLTHPTPASSFGYVVVQHAAVHELVTSTVTRVREEAEPDYNAFACEVAADIAIGDFLAQIGRGNTDPAPLLRARRLLETCCESDYVRKGYWNYRLQQLDAIRTPE